MAMSMGGTQRKAEMNVTPLIDVLLVLIIIFMVILPSSSLGLQARLPEQSDQESAPAAPRNDVVITVQGSGMVKLNQESLAVGDLGERLKKLFAGMASQVIFVRAEKDLEFQQIAEVIDIARGAGLNQIALMTK